MAKLARFGISMERDLLHTFDHLITKKGYHNRSEAIRDMVREKFVEETVSSPNKQIFGALVYIYDHRKRNLEKSLSSLQHEFFQNIISTTHVHIDHGNCLEMILFQGKTKVIKMLSEKLLSFKGVQHGKLTITIPVNHSFTNAQHHAHND